MGVQRVSYYEAYCDGANGECLATITDKSSTTASKAIEVALNAMEEEPWKMVDGKLLCSKCWEALEEKGQSYE